MSSSSRRSTISLVALAQLAWVAALALLLTPRWRVLGGLPSGVMALAVAAVLLATYAAHALAAVRRATRRLERGLAEERRLSATLEQDVAARAAALEDARRVLQRMWWLGQQIALELDPQRVLERFLEAVVDITQADGGVVTLLDDGEMLRVVTGIGLGADMVGHELPVGASIMGSVVRSGRSWTAEDVGMHDREAHEPTLSALRRAGVRGLAMLPIARRGERIGAVAIGSTALRSFTPRALEHVGAMADLLSMALANAELVETLRRAEWRFRTLFRAAPDAVFTVLQSGRIREANDAVRDVTGLDPHLVVGREVVDLAAESDREKLRHALERAFAGSPERLEVVMLAEGRQRAAPNGGASVDPTRATRARRLVSLAISPLREADPPSVLVIGRDVTSEREMRVRLMESDRLAAVGELVAGVAHEVNNPLSSISAFAQLLLRDGGLTASQRESVDVIKSETMRASQVVKDLLAFARRSDPHREPLDLNDVLSRTLRMRGYQLGAHNIQVQSDLASDLPSVIGDARQLQQVFLNLVTNAIQAMATMGGGTLAATTRLEQGTVVLEMRDTGPGIADQVRAHVFEPFFTTKQEGEGTGLGLSVSYGIVHAHGGSIEVADTSSAGTTFRVMLPAAQSVAEQEPARSRAFAPSASTSGPLVRRDAAGFALRSPLVGIRLLCVESDATLRAEMETFGALRGFTVVPAPDGRAALDVVRKTGVDAIVCSVGALAVDGATLLDHLRRERPGLAPRTILVTDESDPAGSRAGLGVLARQPRLTRPFGLERLEELLVATLRGGSAVGRR